MVSMQIDRTSAIKLGTFAGVTAVAGACHYLGLGEHAAGLFGTTLSLAGAGAHAIVGHLGLRLLETVSEDGGGAESGRAAQNRDVHRLIGEAIARILEREADGAPGDKFGVEYLRRAARSFRSDWMTFDLAGTGSTLSEANAPSTSLVTPNLLRRTRCWNAANGFRWSKKSRERPRLENTIRPSITL
jgi:hypothetical protein